jgi:hypothetical protein
MFDQMFAVLLESRIGTRWRHAPHVAGLDNHLRRDVGLAPAEAPRAGPLEGRLLWR